MRADRLLGIVMYLLDRGKATAAELAKRFEASERTIYRDIDALSVSGFPVTALSGPGGGYMMAEGYTLDRAFLSPAEVLGLLGALSGLGDAVRGSGLEAALSKIKAMAASGAGLHESLPPAVTVSLTPWGGSPSGEDELQVLKAAIEKKRVARFSYSGLRGPSRRRDVEPFTLALGGSAWYLHGFCRLRGEFRLFRLSRMSDLEILAEKFDPRARLPVPPVWGAEWGVGPVMEVILRFGPDSIMAVQDSFARRDIVREEDGSFRVSFMWPQEEPPIRFILGFGPGVSVVAPASLKADVARAARELAESNSTA